MKMHDPRKKTQDDRPENMAFVALQPQRSRFLPEDRETNVVCSNCNRTGHRAETCFQILGFPEWWGDRPRNRIGRGRGSAMHAGSSRGRGGPAHANVAREVG